MCESKEKTNKQDFKMKKKQKTKCVFSKKYTVKTGQNA